MRLRRIEAVRFGRLDDIPLGPFGDGLNVVVGPNGAGKTSFTALARHVLYGFPRRNDKAEASYESSMGKRVGRLVFADTEGEWIVERTDGVRGGQCAVRAVAGPERSELVDRITHGVSRNEFRVVFGFGLKDMPDIDPGAGAGGVLSRLYAARVGLSVSPQDVRDALDSEAAELYKARGKTPLVNALLSEIRETKKRIRELEDAAARFSSERDRLTEAQSLLDGLRARRDDAAERRAELESHAQRLEILEDRSAQIRSALQACLNERDEVQRALVSLDIDEELLGRAPELDVLLDELSGYSQRLSAASRLEARAAEVAGEGHKALEIAGIDESAAITVDVGHETRVGLDRRREALSRAQIRMETARRNIEAAQDRASIRQASTQVPSTLAPRLPGIIMLMMGALLVGVGGTVLGDWLVAGLGAVLVASAAAVLYLGRPRRDVSPSAVSRAGDDTLRLAQAELDHAEQELREARSEWIAWAEPRSLLVAGDEPEAASRVVGSVDIWKRARSEHEELVGELASLRAENERYRAALASIALKHVGELERAPLDEVPVHAARLRGLLEEARLKSKDRDRLADQRESLARIAESHKADLSVVEADRAALVERVGEPDADSARVRALAQVAAAAAAGADDDYVELEREVSHLEGRLGEEGNDAQMAEARLALAGLQERLREASERYVVLATASRLIGVTQAYYERARQPAVVQRAGEIFSAITEGAYERIAIPTGGGEIVAFSGSEVVPASELSRGGQEQLYLALRLALVEQLDEVGEGLPVLMDDIFANFDPARHIGAAKAVAELARHRQIVFFTCHPEVADLFESIDPGLTRLVLERC